MQAAKNHILAHYGIFHAIMITKVENTIPAIIGHGLLQPSE